MKSNARRWWKRGLVFALILVSTAVFAVRTWVVPRILANTLTAKLHGTARLSNWWIGKSAGIEGLILAESTDYGSPVWLTTERISADISLLGLLRGQFAPRHVVIDHAKIHLRFNAKGDLLTKGPFVGGGESATTILPDITINRADVTIDQQGRPPFTITGLTGELDREPGGEKLELVSDDPTWGKWRIAGEFQPDFKAGNVKLNSGDGFKISHELVDRIPFVPREVWTNTGANGPISAEVKLTMSDRKESPLHVTTSLELNGLEASLHLLGLISKNSHGHVEIEDGRVTITNFEGQTLSGTIKAAGTLDFTLPAPRIDMLLGLENIDVSQAPKKWQLDELDATGRLTGNAHLLVSLNPRGPDLTGSTGIAHIDDGMRQGIPIKSLDLVMHATGDDIQFEPKVANLSNGKQVLAETRVEGPPGLRLPQAVSTRIELADVNLTKLLGQLEVLTGIKMPVPISGHLALKAQATIPLGQLANLKGYTVRGEATLTSASIDGVHLGRVGSKFDLNQGVLVLDSLQGQLVERTVDPPPATAVLATDAPLVPGAFRGKLRVELVPSGNLTAHFDGAELPIAEILAPYFSQTSPVIGRLTTSFDASAEVSNLGNARAWFAKGKLSSKGIGYLGATLDSIDTDFAIDKGHVSLPDLDAKLGGHPLNADLRVDMDAPREFSAKVDLSNWSAQRLLAMIPDISTRLPIQGMIDGHVVVSGTLLPRKVRADGKVVIRQMAYDAIPFGDVSATWQTEGDEIRFRPIEAKPFGGRVTGVASVPISPGPPIKLEVEVAQIDSSRLAALAGKGKIALEGTASGKLVASIPGDGDLKNLTASLTLKSPSLKVQGVPTGVVTASLKGQEGLLVYEARADGPDGKVRFNGNLPLTGPPADRAANAELRAAGFTLADVWNLVGLKGTPNQLRGLAAIDANLRARSGPDPTLGVHGIIEVRDLRWGPHYPLGNLRGVLARTPQAFRLDSLQGDLFGGAFRGIVWGETPANGPVGMNFELQTDRAALHRLFAFAPDLNKRLDGTSSVRLTGRMDDSLRANAEITVPQAKFYGLPINDLRIPAELNVHLAAANGLLSVRRWTARLSGGRVQGSATMRVGFDRSYNVDVNLTDIDIETFSRAESNDGRPGSGKINGRISLSGPDPTLPQRLRGKVELSLNDASLGEIPVIRELDRFLGAARGGVVEEGSMLATIGDRQISIDQLTLAGRVIQVHATGLVSFDGGLDLAVLVNTNQIISQSGQSLIGLIPGLRNALGRNQEALMRVSTYLSSRLLKFRISGTIKNPTVAIDPGVSVGDSATGFFADALKLPLGRGR